MRPAHQTSPRQCWHVYILRVLPCPSSCWQAYYVEATGYFPGDRAESPVCSGTILMPAKTGDQAVCGEEPVLAGAPLVDGRGLTR